MSAKLIANGHVQTNVLNTIAKYNYNTFIHNTTSNMKCIPNTNKIKFEVLYLCAVLLNACGIIPRRVSK